MLAIVAPNLPQTDELAAALEDGLRVRSRSVCRVGRLETHGGWDLADPDLRFALSLAARVLRQSR